MCEGILADLTSYLRGRGDPRLKVLWYFAWYCVLWTNSPIVLIIFLSLQLALGVTLRIFRGTSGKAILLVVYLGLILTGISVWIGNETPKDLISVWCKWGVIVLATFNTAAAMELQEVFAALNTFRLPQTFVFTLGIALKTIPLVFEEVKRIRFARLTWGHLPSRGLQRMGNELRALWEILVPTLLGIMERAEKMWFTIELRGLRSRLYRPLLKQKHRSLDFLIITTGIFPLLSILLVRFVSKGS